MAAGILVAFEEYLSRTCEPDPDMDYADGVLGGRNMGKRKPSSADASRRCRRCSQKLKDAVGYTPTLDVRRSEPVKSMKPFW